MANDSTQFEKGLQLFSKLTEQTVEVRKMVESLASAAMEAPGHLRPNDAVKLIESLDRFKAEHLALYQSISRMADAIWARIPAEKQGQ